MEEVTVVHAISDTALTMMLCSAVLGERADEPDDAGSRTTMAS
jgi:hypothetical protein